MNSLYTLIQNFNTQPIANLPQVQNKNKTVLFVLGVALNVSVTLYMKSYKQQELAQIQHQQNVKDSTQIASSSHSLTQNKEEDDWSIKQINRTSQKRKFDQPESNKKDETFILSLKDLLLEAERRQSKDGQPCKQKSAAKSIQELLQEIKPSMDTSNTIEKSGSSIDELLMLQNHASLALIPAPIISHEQIDEKRRSLISRNVDTWKYGDKNCSRQQRELKKLF